MREDERYNQWPDDKAGVVSKETDLTNGWYLRASNNGHRTTNPKTGYTDKTEVSLEYDTAFAAEGVRDCGNGVHALSVSPPGACLAGVLRQGKRLLCGPLSGPQGEIRQASCPLLLCVKLDDGR